MTEHELHDNKQSCPSSEEPSNVGYCRPPKGSQFKKGTSGNPRGRPKGAQNLKAQLLQVLTKPVVVNDRGKRRSIPLAVAIMQVQGQQALKGDVQSQKAVVNNLKELGVLDQEPKSLVPKAETFELTNKEIDALTDEQLQLIAEAERLRVEIVARRSIH